MTKTENIKKKIAKLLALAIDQEGKPEGVVASKMAMKLMAEYGIAKGDIADGDGCQMQRIVLGIGQMRWAYNIVGAVGKLTGIFVACGSGGYAWLMGREIDVAVAEYLVESLMNQCYADHRAWKKDRVSYGGVGHSRKEGNVYKESWAAGLTEKIDRIVQMQKAQAAEESTSQALTVVGRRSVAERWGKEQWNFGSRSGRGNRTHNADGRDAGRNANVQGGVKGSSVKRIGS
jgi:hypothetical protein